MQKQFGVILVLFLLYHGSESFFPFTKQRHLSPVIFVPGDGGSQINAKLNKTSTPNFSCAKVYDWFNIWLNIEELVIPVVYCWVDNVKLYYDNVTRTTHNTPGVDIAIPGWGNPEVVEWIDPTHNKAGAYFKDIANILVSNGYERKKSIFAAPYDFRKAPNENTEWFTNLKTMVQDAYYLNNETPITFISHSMGSPMVLVFLQQQTVEWKAKYIKRQISLAGAWAGSIKALKVFAMGDDLESFFLSAKILKEEQITHPSTAWLLPSPLFWGPNEVLVTTPSRNYTMSQLESFFTAIDYQTGWEMRKDTLSYTMNFHPPDVELHCLYGSGLPTVERLQYKKDDISGETPKLINGKGDGTVNERSLKACHSWQGYTSSHISNLNLPNVDHMGILSNETVLNYIKSVLIA